MMQRNMWRRWGVIGLIGLGWGAVVMIPAVAAAPNAQVTATPAPVVLPSLSPTPALEESPTPTRTPTPVGPALAEALEGPTNVRAAPDIEAERLGVINPGDFYPVIGRAAGTLWLKIQYPESPSGTAWVFEQVVALTGDVDNIPELNISSEPTIDVGGVASTQTLEAMAETPGALATATAQAAIDAVLNNETPTPSPTSGPLPTYTYPPGVSSEDTGAAATQIAALPTAQSSSTDGLPPIIPIIALGALGGFGLLIGVLRRLR